jgi:hypothetical protein
MKRFYRLLLAFPPFELIKQARENPRTREHPALSIGKQDCL